MKFTVIIPPKAQMRAGRRGFKAGNRICVQTYKDPKQEQEENRLITLLYQHQPPAPMTGPLILGIKAYLPMPKKSKKWQAAALAGETRPVTTPDLDNLEKHLKDCCKGIFWVDDKQVVGHTPEFGKYYGDPPRWEIEILTLEEYRAGLMERYQELLRGLVGEPQAELGPPPLVGIDAYGPSVSCGKGKVALGTQQVSGRLF